MRRKASRDNLGEECYFSADGKIWFKDTLVNIDYDDEFSGPFYNGLGWYNHCEVKQELITLTLSEHSEILNENAKLKAELAELKKGEPEREAWYLGDDEDGYECVMYLNKEKKMEDVFR